MKCIRNKKTFIIIRVPDNVAQTMVASGQHEYVPKHLYKEDRYGKNRKD